MQNSKQITVGNTQQEIILWFRMSLFCIIWVKIKTNELQSNWKGIVWTLQQSSFLYSYHSGMEFLVVKLKTFDATSLWKAVAQMTFKIWISASTSNPLATDKKWPLSQFHISYKNSEIGWPKVLISDSQSQFFMSKVIRNFQKKISLKNTILRAHFLLLTVFEKFIL